MDYFESLTVSEITTAMLMDNFLRTKKAQKLSVDDIEIIFDKFGFLTNLILLHFNNPNYFSDKPELYEKVLIKYFNSEPDTISSISQFMSPELMKKLFMYFLLDFQAENKSKAKEIANSILFAYLNTLKGEKSFYNILNAFTFYKEFNLFEYFNFEDFADLWSRLTDNFDFDIRVKFRLAEIASGIFYTPVDCETILAFKGTMEDGTSTMCNFKKYEAGQEYYEYSDKNPYNENSFGLSVWNFSNAEEYSKFKVIPVLIKYSDITFFDIKTGKIRCDRFKVIENTDLF